MAPLAYLFLPVTGMFAYFSGRSHRVRFHGLQAVLLGVLWPAALYGASAVSESATRVTFGLGVVAWLALIVITATGRDPRFPLVGRTLMRWAETPPGD